MKKLLCAILLISFTASSCTTKITTTGKGRHKKTIKTRKFL